MELPTCRIDPASVIAMPGVDPDTSPRQPLRATAIAKATASAVGSAARTRLLSSQVTVDGLRPSVRRFVEDYAKVLCPDRVHVCDGSESENQALLKVLQDCGRIRKLDKYDNW